MTGEVKPAQIRSSHDKPSQFFAKLAIHQDENDHENDRRRGGANPGWENPTGPRYSLWPGAWSKLCGRTGTRNKRKWNAKNLAYLAYFRFFSLISAVGFFFYFWSAPDGRPGFGSPISKSAGSHLERALGVPIKVQFQTRFGISSLLRPRTAAAPLGLAVPLNVALVSVILAAASVVAAGCAAAV